MASITATCTGGGQSLFRQGNPQVSITYSTGPGWIQIQEMSGWKKSGYGRSYDLNNKYITISVGGSGKSVYYNGYDFQNGFWSGGWGVTNTTWYTSGKVRISFTLPGSGTSASGATFATGSISVPSAVTKPPVPTNVKLVRNSDSQAKATWSHGGSGTSVEKKSFVYGETNKSGNWVNIYNGAKTTSYTWNGLSANSCYRVRIGAENDAGNAGGHGYSNYIYTTPSGPKSLSNAVVVLVNGSPELSFNIDKGNTKYPSTKVDFQYSNDNSTWRGSGGTSGGVYSVNTTSTIALSAGSMDGTLKSYITNMKNGGKLYIRARVWNADNTLASGFSGSVGVAYNEQPQIYFWVPDGTNIANVRIYVNKP